MSFRYSMIAAFAFLSISLPSQSRSEEPQHFIVCSGNCESTAADQRPEGYPTLLKLDTQTGQGWVLIRLHQFPFTYYWEKVADIKPAKPQ